MSTGSQANEGMLTDKETIVRPKVKFFGWGFWCGLALGTLFGVYVIAPSLQELVADKSEWLPVVVAYTNIPAQTRITRDLIQVRPMPRDLITKNTLTRVQDVEGATSTTLIPAKEPIHTADIYRP